MKKIIALMLAVLMLASLFVGCSAKKTEAETTAAAAETTTAAAAADTTTAAAAAETTAAATGKYKVGITIQSLENSYWAGVFAQVQNLLKEKGWEYTLVDCKDNSATQISQIENFISSGCNMIMVHPSDPNAIEDVCKKARDAGIKVMCWDDKMTNTDVNWVLDNTKLGTAIGEAAGDFIAQHYSKDNKVEVAIMDYPQTPILLQREQGIMAGLENKAKDLYTIVAQQPAIDAATAQSNMETILQAHPNCKVVCSIGAGGDIGANQVFLEKYNNKVPDDVGIFSADATKQQLESILNNEASRVSVGFEGNNLNTAKACVDIYEKLLTGAKFDDQNVFRPLTPISKTNASDFLKGFE